MLFRDANAQQLKALNRCRSSEFSPVMELLHNNLTVVRARLAKADDMVAIYRLQGELSALEAFVSAVEESPKRLSVAESQGR